MYVFKVVALLLRFRAFPAAALCVIAGRKLRLAPAPTDCDANLRKQEPAEATRINAQACARGGSGLPACRQTSTPHRFFAFAQNDKGRSNCPVQRSDVRGLKPAEAVTAKLRASARRRLRPARPAVDSSFAPLRMTEAAPEENSLKPNLSKFLRCPTLAVPDFNGIGRRFILRHPATNTAARRNFRTFGLLRALILSPF